MSTSPTELEYFVVDVFTGTALAGNPLAVVMNTAGLTTGRMQAIAREFNLSETTFVERGPVETERHDGVRVRIFTTQEELNFAGHPTLGTASVLRLAAPEAAEGETIKLKLNVGTVPVRFAGQGLNGEMTQRDPEFGVQLERAEVARLAGLSLDDLDPELPPQVVSTGTAFAIVVLRSLEALARLKVNHEEATPWLRERGARWFYVIARDPNQDADGTKCNEDSTKRNEAGTKRNEDGTKCTEAGTKRNEDGTKCTEAGTKRYRARMQFYNGEDPATGSAAGSAISYLVAHEAVSSGEFISLRQGVEMGRPSDMRLAARRDGAGVTDVRVGGSTVLVAKGRLFLP
jgi:trans-2,3-dihydro-3-hydroxyanthranilate isomerase